jgi:hypothetical protein
MTAKSRSPRNRSARLAVESLEGRTLLSTLAPTAASVPSGHGLPTPIVTQLPGTGAQNFSTIPSNGDVNPYGVAFVPTGFKGGGKLRPGDLLVSNFNNGTSNFQGTGVTIGLFEHGRTTPKTFFQGTGLGLTTGLAVLKSGFVVVGNLPSTDGTADTAPKGSILILNSSGHVVLTIASPIYIQGPWDLAVNDNGNSPQIFVANVENGTVSRIDLRIRGQRITVTNMTQVASGYGHRPDAAAFFVGPTGLAYNPITDTLFVNSTLDNKVYAVDRAGHVRNIQGRGRILFADNSHLHGPLGLALAPNGDLLIANGDVNHVDPNQPSEVVEITQAGKFIGQFSTFDQTAAPFGIGVGTSGDKVTIGVVNDDNNTINVYHVEV